MEEPSPLGTPLHGVKGDKVTDKIDPKELIALGWRRQSVASDPRLSEAVAIYESLGLEVLLVPVLEEGASDGGAGTCTSCFGADEDPDRYKVIYTRPKPGARTEQDELFD